MYAVPEQETVTLWRPTGPKELELVAASGYRRWPPRLPEQPFLPDSQRGLRTEDRARLDVRDSGVGYVMKFSVRRDFLDGYEVRQVGGRTILEYWIPAGDLEAFNYNLVGRIEVIAEYRSERE